MSTEVIIIIIVFEDEADRQHLTDDPLSFRRLQIHSRAAGGASEQRPADRREHAVPGDEGEGGEGAAGHEALPVTL